MPTYRTIKELPGCPVGTGVELVQHTDIKAYAVYTIPSREHPIAFIPAIDFCLWLQEVGVKKIEYLPSSPDYIPKMVNQHDQKINELITAFNSLPPADKIMVKE